MTKRLASIAILSLPLSLLSIGSASAGECNSLAGVMINCSQPSSPPPSSSQPSSQPAPAPAPARTISEVPGAAERLMELVNNDRAAHGLGSLSVRGDVVGIAHPHSRDMASRRTIWHNDGYFSEGTRAHLRSSLRGENVAMNSSVDDAHRRLMNSPNHRANILNGRFTQAGFSVVQDEAGTLYVTENFMTPEGSRAAATPARSSNAKADKATKANTSKATKAQRTGKRVVKAKGSKRVVKARAPRRARTAQRTRR